MTHANRQNSGGRHFGDVLWVSPAAVGVGVVIAPHLQFLPMVPRVIATVTVMTVLMGEAVEPIRRRWRSRRLRLPL